MSGRWWGALGVARFSQYQLYGPYLYRFVLERIGCSSYLCLFSGGTIKMMTCSKFSLRVLECTYSTLFF
jgi:hypothetical protein